MQKGMAAIIAFLLVMAWQYRKNKALLFVIVATLFASAGLLASGRAGFPEWTVTFLALAWLICMLIAGLLALEKLFYSIRKMMKQSRIHKSETRHT
jgi:hypothetical protein